MISLRLFGQFEIRNDGEQIDLANSKLAGLVAILATAGDKALSREKLADMLWGSHFEAQARQNLRQALSRLRKLLGPDAIIADDHAVRLDAAQCVSDHQQFTALARSGAMEALAEATSIARGELLEGIAVREEGFTEWLAAERRQISAFLRSMHLRLGAHDLADGRAGDALRQGEALLARDPLDEEAHRLRLTSLAALGRKGEAIRLHQAFTETLKKEFGAAPEAETQAVAETLRTMRPPSESPPEAARPSLAVLPFESSGDDAVPRYFADGMADELITALSRLRWLTVISRSATFTARDRRLDARQAGEAFGVRYVLEGSIRRAGQALRITGQLIEAASGAAIWAGRFDGTLDNVFELQDEVAAKVVGALQPRLERAEIDRSRQKPTNSLDAYDYYLRGLAEVHRWSREANQEALRHFHRAIELDPRFGAAYGLAARCYSQRKTSGWVQDQAFEMSETLMLAKRALEFGYDDPIALSSAGIALAFVAGRVREGGEMIDRALDINPGLAVAWMFSAWIKAWSGEADEAVERTNRAIGLSPQDPYIASMRRATAFAHFVGGRYAEAIGVAQSVGTYPQNSGVAAASVAASAVLLGKDTLAAEALMELRGAEPGLRLSNLRARFPLVRDKDFERLAGALRQAGLPE